MEKRFASRSSLGDIKQKQVKAIDCSASWELKLPPCLFCFLGEFAIVWPAVKFLFACFNCDMVCLSLNCIGLNKFRMMK